MKHLTIFSDLGSIPVSVIDLFEAEVGRLFPILYKEFISQHNAAYINQNMFNFISPIGTDERDCNFLAYGESHAYETIYDCQLDETECGLTDLVVFAICANGDYICFDYRANPTTDNPPVVVVLHDWWEEGADGVRRMLVCDVAKDFEAFVDLLYEDKDED